MNKALLLKWKWRILTEDKAIWSDVLLLRYREPKVKVLAYGRRATSSKDSFWWRDVLNNDVKDVPSEEGFSGCIQYVVKKGDSVSFWFGSWLAAESLSFLFPDIFAACVNIFSTVADVFSWDNDSVIWLYDSIVDEENLALFSAASSSFSGQWQQLCSMLQSATFEKDGFDEFKWKLNSDGRFTVASVSLLIANGKEAAWHPITLNLIKSCWNSIVSIKIHTFLWRVCINRLPTKISLSERGAIDSSVFLYCEFCRNHLETSSHLFFQCGVAKYLWKRIYLWLGEDLPFSLEEFLKLDIVVEKVKTVNARKNITSIWIASVWSLWNMRNAMIFKKIAYSFERVFYNVIFLSWCWLASSNPIRYCSFYDWYTVPLDCFKSI
ncbi:uncharacterized protein LOC131650122 [Vicia villosa]|uniref:uncharacterized protein LOC131650122 n=1 Tax=Vicia villosa TaxID=3911 RepID=UPI00273B8B42|nr:uncharacterized protein LOC131650122 [Vicia villosa]